MPLTLPQLTMVRQLAGSRTSTPGSPGAGTPGPGVSVAERLRELRQQLRNAQASLREADGVGWSVLLLGVSTCACYMVHTTALAVERTSIREDCTSCISSRVPAQSLNCSYPLLAECRVKSGMARQSSQAATCRELPAPLATTQTTRALSRSHGTVTQALGCIA